MVYDEFKRKYVDSSFQKISGEQSVESEEDSLDWAKQAYARLKQQQKELQQNVDNQSPSKIDSSKQVISEEDSKQDFATSSLDEEAVMQRDFCQQKSESKEEMLDSVSYQEEINPTLGEFDETFTWSAEVLSAQGRNSEEISVEEIDWLGRLRKGLEKTRKSFVTGLLEKLGDDHRN